MLIYILPLFYEAFILTGNGESVLYSVLNVGGRRPGYPTPVLYSIEKLREKEMTGV